MYSFFEVKIQKVDFIYLGIKVLNSRFQNCFGMSIMCRFSLITIRIINIL